MDDGFPPGVVTGVLLTVVIGAIVLAVATADSTFSHDLGAEQTVCVQINVQREEHCVTGNQVIEWLRATRIR